MFCTGCGTPIQPHDYFCHHCGKEMHPTDVGQPPHRRRTAPWVIVIALLFLFFSFYYTWAILSYSDLEEPVQKQLTSLREGKIPEAYFEYTSKQFQGATSLEQFKSFVASHPILTNHRSASFGSPIIENNLGKLEGTLLSASGEAAPIQYLLERQDEEWKVLNMQLSNPVKDEEALFAPINRQLEELKKGKDKEAYEGVSNGFKKATSYDQFSSFVSRFPVLKNHTGHIFKERAVEGDRAAVRVDLTTDKGVVPLEYHLVKESGAWKVWSFQVVPPQTQAPDASLMNVPIQNMLESLKKKEIEKAYNDNVAEEFKKITTLAIFESFVEKYRIFTNYTKVDYKPPRMEESGGKVVTVLHNKKGETATVEYTLGVENGVWKIWGLRLVNHSQNKLDPDFGKDFSAKTLSTLAESQLEAIKAGNLKSAYEDYTSSQFQAATSLDVFKQFVSNYSIFSKYKTVQFSEMTLNNNVATLTAKFTDENGKDIAIDYDFILDGDQWKILRVQVQTPPGSNNLSYFPKIVIGSKINEEGAVENETTVINDLKEAIYANIYVNGKKGDTITVVMKHLDTGSAIKPITSTPMPKDGVFRTSFSFNPPPQGWPVGKYALEITASAGETQTYDFEVKN